MCQHTDPGMTHKHRDLIHSGRVATANLSEHEEERLLKVLRKHRAAIGYTLDDLKGISPTLCQHKINMEPDAKPVVDHQRRLNPKMKEMVRTEILKLLEACIIYISYS